MPRAPDPDPAPAHRPQIPIDWKLVDKLLEADCKGNEIAGHFSMHPDTFYDRVKIEKGVCFTDYSSSKKSSGDALLKAAQFAKALGTNPKGNAEMLKWLGEERLGQGKKDKTTIPPNDESVHQQIETNKELYTLKQQLSEVLEKLKKYESWPQTDPIPSPSDQAI